MPLPRFGPPYRIATRRVVLRCWDPADTPALQALLAGSREHLRPWVPGIDDEPTLDEKLHEVRSWRAAFDLDQVWLFALLGAEDGTLAGGVVVNPLPRNTVDVGGWVAEAHARRGYVSDAFAAVARVAFEVLGITRVQALCRADNQRSIAMLRKLGFTHEATPRHEVDRQRVDEMMWSILPDEWPATPAAALAAEARAWDALGNRLF
ncbi:MAG TPA: GNAT family protein [Longimicrobium sp.]|jgi:RimJ/RimL family protein N-acetyltransferase|nr:GNAT family protein [Longimicrobium sp.]